jgi:hypothetical protein
VFKFVLGEIAVCIFLLGVLGSVLMALFGLGYGVKRVAVWLYPKFSYPKFAYPKFTYSRFTQFAQNLAATIQPAKLAPVFVTARRAKLQRVSSRAA